MGGAKVGDQKNNFTIQGQNNVFQITINPDDLVTLIKANPSAALAADKTIVAVDTGNLTAALDNYDEANKIAAVTFNYTAQTLSVTADTIDKNKLVNLNANQLTAYLNNQSGIKDFSLKFWPSFIRRAPFLVDRINIQINSQ